MAGSADDDQPRAPPREAREVEEGQVLSGYHAGAGSDTDTDDEDARYFLQSRHDDDQWVRAGSERRGNSPAHSFGSDYTLSDDDAENIGDAAGAVTVARVGDVPLPVFPCGVCGREFRCSKAVHGHMRVHAMAAKEEKLKAEAAGGSGGGASAVEEVGDSGSVSPPVVVTAIPRLFDDTMTTVQSACSNNPVVNGGSGSSSARSSVEPSATGQSMANIAAAPATPAAAPEQVPVAPPPAPVQQVPAAPQQPPAAAPQYLHPMQRVYDGPLQTIVRTAPSSSTRRLAPAENSQSGFSCKECNRWFPTHQGLGGHVAGHKNRRIQAAALAAAAAGIDPEDHMACRGRIRPAKSHTCKVCGQVYPNGVSLGGHMRKHYNGKPIVPRKRLRLGLPELALAQPLQRAGPSMEAPIMAQPLATYQQEHVAPVVEVAEQPPQAPLPAGTVRLFGVTITQQAKKEAKEEEPPVDESMKEVF